MICCGVPKQSDWPNASINLQRRSFHVHEHIDQIGLADHLLDRNSQMLEPAHSQKLSEDIGR